MERSAQRGGKLRSWLDGRVGLTDLEKIAAKKQIPVHRHTLVRPHRAIVHPRVPARPAMPAQRAPHPPQAQGAAVLLDSVLAPSSTPPSSVVQSAVSAVTTTAAAPVRAVAALAGPTLSALSHH